MYVSWVEISKSALLHNLSQFQRLVGSGVSVMPIVKSNAYGHGMTEVARLVATKVRWLGVVNLAEALALRQAGIKKNIFVLSYVQPELLGEGIRQNIALPVYNLAFAKAISKKAVQLKKIVRVHVKIDTGTSRVGFLPAEAAGAIASIRQLPNIKIEGIWSHFASSEEAAAFTQKQLRTFNQVLANVHQQGIRIPLTHFACSAATVTVPAARYNMVRLGLSLYGLWPSKFVQAAVLKKHRWFNLKTALSWKTKIVQVKTVAKGTRVSYGGTYVTKKKTKLAVLAVGYWEGFDRQLSCPPLSRSAELWRGRGVVLIGGKRCPVLGRVCMNLTMVDVSQVKNVKAGDEVVLIGEQACPPSPFGLRRGRGLITADELAEKIGTINYEVVSRINPLLRRVYVK